MDKSGAPREENFKRLCDWDTNDPTKSLVYVKSYDNVFEQILL